MFARRRIMYGAQGLLYNIKYTRHLENKRGVNLKFIRRLSLYAQHYCTRIQIVFG